MLLVCARCHPDSPVRELGKNNATFYLAKWYPGAPWYSNRETNESFDEWLECHSHHAEQFPFRFEYQYRDAERKSLSPNASQ